MQPVNNKIEFVPYFLQFDALYFSSLALFSLWEWNYKFWGGFHFGERFNKL